MTSAPLLTRLGAFISEGALEPDAATVETVRDALIDVLGCILVGAQEEVTQKTQAALAHRTGKAVLYGTGKTLAPEAAALANAVSGHAIEFDDWEIPGNTHPTVVIAPALLAAAQGEEISGRAFLEAYLIGFEVIARMGEAMNFSHFESGGHSTATLGPIGAAAAVARLWQLPPEQAGHAVGIAISRAAGLTDQFGSDTKPLQGGFAAEAGVVAATMARAGLTAQPHVLQGPKGYTALTSKGTATQLETAFSALGAPLSLKTHGLVFKPYPSCGYTHRIIDAAISLHGKGINLSSVTQVDIHMPDFHAAVLPFGIPDSARTARFSLPFCAALALTKGRAAAGDFQASVWEAPDVMSLMEKTQVRPFAPKRPDLNYDPDEPDRLTLTFADGSRETASVIYPTGAPQAPMSHDQILAKFCANAGCPLDDPKVRALKGWTHSPNLLETLRCWS